MEQLSMIETTKPTQLRRRWITASWTILLSALLIGGAIYLKAYDPLGRLAPPALRAFFKSELCHVPAHMLLYGTLTLGCRLLSGRGWRPTLLAVLAVALLQEAGQSLLFGRGMGGAELFDLGVDLAVSVAVLLMMDWRAERARSSIMQPLAARRQ
jgi:hypothetical protein